MNRIDPNKLKLSKWTSAQPRNKEKHFLVTDVMHDADGVAQTCVLEAVYTKREFEIDWRLLQDEGQWLMGWR